MIFMFLPFSVVVVLIRFFHNINWLLHTDDEEEDDDFCAKIKNGLLSVCCKVSVMVTVNCCITCTAMVIKLPILLSLTRTLFPACVCVCV